MGKKCFDCFNKTSNGWCNHFHQDCWDEPLRDFNTGYEDAEECPGFEPKENYSSGCFMTSACVGYMGKADDCIELETLRKFRDQKLRYIAGGEELIKTYYHVAPQIVRAIDASSKKEQYYQDIYDSVCECVNQVNNNEDDKAIKTYLKMFNKYRIIFDK